MAGMHDFLGTGLPFSDLPAISQVGRGSANRNKGFSGRRRPASEKNASHSSNPDNDRAHKYAQPHESFRVTAALAAALGYQGDGQTPP